MPVYDDMAQLDPRDNQPLVPATMVEGSGSLELSAPVHVMPIETNMLSTAPLHNKNMASIPYSDSASIRAASGNPHEAALAPGLSPLLQRTHSHREDRGMLGWPAPHFDSAPTPATAKPQSISKLMARLDSASKTLMASTGQPVEITGSDIRAGAKGVVDGSKGCIQDSMMYLKKWLIFFVLNTVIKQIQPPVVLKAQSEENIMKAFLSGIIKEIKRRNAWVQFYSEFNLVIAVTSWGTCMWG